MKDNIPYNVMRHSRWEQAPRDPITLFTYFSATVGLSTGMAIIAAGVSYLAITAVTSWAISALMPRPDFSSFGSQGTLVNSRDATAPADFVYGQVRKGGTVSFYEATGDQNKFLHQIIVLAAHEVEEIGSIYINDQIVTLDSNGFVTTSDWVISGGASASGIRIQKFLGNQTAAPADLLSESELTGANALTANFIGNGIAYLYVRYEYDANVFASGIPLVTAVVKGKKVYDPRTTSTAYSNNAALCVRDFITSAYGLNDSAIDEVVFSAAANESDENVALSGGGNEKRYTINGITLDDLRGPIGLSTRTTMRDSFNGVTGTFNDAEADFITADYPAITSSAFKTQDGGDEINLDLPLPFTTSAATAQRIAKMTLYRGREQMSLSADFGLEAFNVEVGDIIAFTNERYGFDEKEFEVIGWKFSSNQQAGDLRVNLTLQETSQAAFSWNAEESAIIDNDTNLPNALGGLGVTNFAVTGGGRTQGDGTFINSGILSWTAAISSFVSYYDVEWKAVSDSDYASTTTTNNAIELSPLVDGIQYTFRVRGVSVMGNKGTFVAATFTGGGDTTAPGLPTSVAGTGAFRANAITWVNPTDDDFKSTEIYVNTSNTSSGSTLLGSGAGTDFTHTGLPQTTTRYYWLKSVDFSGNKSSFSAGTGAVATLADPANGTDGTDGTNGINGSNGTNGTNGTPGAAGSTGNTVVTGKVYYQTLQASSPGTPSATSYNVSSAAFVGLTSGWSLTQPSVDITDTSIKEWSSNFTVTINGVTSAQTLAFTAASGAVQVTADIESDNYVAGSAGWKIERDTGNAEFQNATIRGTLNASDITAGTISVSRIPTLSSAKFDVLSNSTFGTNHDSIIATGNAGSVSFTPTSASNAIITVNLALTMGSRGGDGNYYYDMRLKVNGTTAGDAVRIVGGSDGTTPKNLVMSHGFAASANTTYTITLHYTSGSGRKATVAIDQGALISIFTQQ